VLVAVGSQDPIVPAENARELVALLRRAGADVTVCFENAGHGLTDTTFASTQRWLAKRAASPNSAEALQADRRPGFAEPVEEAIYDFCQQLHRTHTADEATLRRLINALGNKAAIEVTGLCGYYTMVAMTLNAFGIGPGPARNQPPTNPC
jgi:hypothetical protein